MARLFVAAVVPIKKLHSRDSDVTPTIPMASVTVSAATITIYKIWIIIYTVQ
jgi:hypothetical protein